MTDAPTPEPDPTPHTQEESSDLEELNDEGVGGTIGEKDTFEPEESEGVEE